MQAKVRIACGFSVIDEPGLASVASATAHPASIILRAGANVFIPRKNDVPGSITATVSLPASASIPASLTCIR